ncbi:MMPL family transporter [Thermoactinomyces sp. DSM 45892]|uniref:MMPL family transporter n=1 Tax=Thermoactinomyces sp. DSM 45892 TaxID=1882753 RepID=UPI003515F9A3
MLKGRWWIVLIWVITMVGLVYVAPSMSDLVREKGRIEVPEGYSSKLASQLIVEGYGKRNSSQVALVFYGDQKLTDHEIKEAEEAVHRLEQNKESLGIKKITTHFKEKQLTETLVSKDGKAILASLNVDQKKRSLSTLTKSLSKTLDGIEVKYAYTNESIITSQLLQKSEAGLKKTEEITVIFILLVLLLVFRSVVAPVIPLLTVGITYLTSQSVISLLVDQFDFPISGNTRIFLVAILFGIGTDYCILLLSRFKEELIHSGQVVPAIIETYKRAGRTVLISGIAVMVGFASIGFSEFNLYQSAAAVAVGIVVLLIALFTLVPFFMALLGKAIYWPSKRKLEHKDSRLWGFIGSFSLSRPILSILLVAIICVPFMMAYKGEVSFNSIEEIGEDVPTIKAFRVIEQSFGAGESMPTKLVFKNDDRLDSVDYFYVVERISRELDKVDLVASVRSITRPMGEPFEKFLITKQSEKLGKGLGKGKEGVEKVSEGLKEANDELTKKEPELKRATDGIQRLIDGTSLAESKLTLLETYLSKMEQGMKAGSVQAKKELETAKEKTQELLRMYQNFSKAYKGVNRDLQQIDPLLNQLDQIKEEHFQNLEKNMKGLGALAEYQKIKGNILSAIEKKNKMMKFRSNLEKMMENEDKVTKEINAFTQGIEKQVQGLEKAANAQGQIVKQLPRLTDGLSRMNDGQRVLLGGFGKLRDQLEELKSGLSQGADGLNKVSDGLGVAQRYLTDLSGTSSVDGFYMPADIVEDKGFQNVLEVYLSPDRKTVTMDVVFKSNPYARESMDQVEKLKEAVHRATKGTKLENATVAIGGITSMNADLKDMSNQDYSRTVTLMLLGIGLVLVFLFRSFMMPIYIIGSLLLTYYTSMAINEVLFVDILGYSGISWIVPFFAFVMLIALGVDYSIFLMDRFNEYHDIPVADAMLFSMKKMGTVIISAVIILGGTFAAMIPSGLLSLIQIASIILIGLCLYTFVVLPLLIPVLVKSLGKANWWPFRR